MDSTSPIRVDFHEALQGVSAGEYLQVYRDFFDIYYQSKDMAAFHVFQGKLEPPTLIKLDCFIVRTK